MSQAGIEVFRDLSIDSDQLPLNGIRASLLGGTSQEWIHDNEQEDKLKKYAGSVNGEDVIVFRYVGGRLPKSSLTLWERNGVYNLTNIVPSEIGQLDVKQYNDLLVDFIYEIIEKSSDRKNINIDLTDSIRNINSWTSLEAANALEMFSSLANKSTTNAHPSDLQRWEEFVINSHLSSKKLPVEILKQWLVEIDGWDEESASNLTIEYEQGISLLESYDSILKG